MPALVLLLSLVAPSTEPPALPIGSIRPEDPGFYSFGDSSVALGLGSRWGRGYAFADGSSVEVACDGAIYRRTYLETETYRLAFCVGSSLGARQEWYLRHGLVAILELRIGGASRASLVWYPVEVAQFSLVFDPVRGRLGWGWRIML